MRAVEISSPGGPEVLKVRDLPKPAPQPNEIVVKVAAAGVNRPDVLQRMGRYPVPPGASPLPGLEIAGEVVELGSSAKMWKPGDKVCALANGGGLRRVARLGAHDDFVLVLRMVELGEIHAARLVQDELDAKLGHGPPPRRG